MYFDDAYSTIFVSLLDINGFNTSPTTGESITISLAFKVNVPGGSFDGLSSSWVFPGSDSEGGIKETKYSGQLTTGEATITATASVGGLPVASVTINVILALIPDHIKLRPTYQIIPKEDTSTITAIVYDYSGKIVSNYAGTINFTKDPLDFGTFNGNNSVYTTNGVAEIKLSSDSSGTATIEASLLYNLNLIKSIEAAVVEFYGIKDHIELNAIPENVKIGIGNTSTITATVCDSTNIHVPEYAGYITFTKDPPSFGTFSGVNPVYTTIGIATIKLFSEVPGTATITASDGTISSTNGCTVKFYEATAIELVEDSAKYYPAVLEVVFDIKAIGEDILLDEMGISWVPNAANEKFQKIVIGSDVLYTGNSVSGAIVDIVDKTLVAGEIYSVKLTFGKSVGEKVFMVEFFPYSGSYKLENITPITQ
jgi:hypothetical protein